MRVVLAVVVIGLLLYIGRQRQQGGAPDADPPAVKVGPAGAEPEVARPQRPEQDEPVAETAGAPQVVGSVKGMVIRDLEGQVAFRGTVDLTPTLRRIAAGTKLKFSNDGSVFQNRERRLPRQPSGYYHEWVHPTPDLPGPGPQRIVTGQQGEVFYTPDHYRTFRRLDERTGTGGRVLETGARSREPVTGFDFVEQPEEFREAEALVVRIPRGIRSKRKLLAVLADKLEFPRYFGWNWDALNDCLTEAMSSARPIVVVHSDLPFGARSELRRIYLTLLSDVADRGAELGGTLRAVFATADEAAVRAATTAPR